MTEREDDTKVQNVIELELTSNLFTEKTLKYEARYLNVIAYLLRQTGKAFSDIAPLLKKQSQSLRRQAAKKRSLIEISPLRTELILLNELLVKCDSQLTAASDLEDSLFPLMEQLLRVKALIGKRATQPTER